MEYTISSFGHYQDTAFDLITMTNEDVTISFSNLGARINQWQIGTDNLVLGFDQADQAFQANGYYYGATIGRVGGRISDGRFTLRGTTYQLPQNNGHNHFRQLSEDEIDEALFIREKFLKRQFVGRSNL